MATAPGNPLERVLDFVDELDRRFIFRRLASVRDAVMVEVHRPGERWEVEFFADGHTEVEVFRSDGDLLSGPAADAALYRLLREHDAAEADAQERSEPRRQALSE